jgi:L-rhamnose-H+ transport protein
MMNPNPLLGVLLHAFGGLAAGSFYIPFKRVRHWAWESYWLVGGVFSWLIAPWIAASIVCPNLLAVLRDSPRAAIFWSYFFGVLWGIGGLTFGLSMRYLGMSLGYALALGFCAAFGTVIPPLFTGQFAAVLANLSGWVTLGGVLVCIAGIVICGRAGVSKERELSAAEKTQTISEFDFGKGVWVAVFAGVMSACMAFAIAAGKPIAALAIERGTAELWQNTPVFVVILAGGFTTNFVWCGMLNFRNRTFRNYVDSEGASLTVNYLFSALAGITWYLQFLFYGMGTTRMGRYDFSSWTIHMAFIIVFSNLWGLHFGEWKGASRSTHGLIRGGIFVLVTSTIVIGAGNYIAALKR